MTQLFKHLLHRYSHLNWAVADQVLVSGINFLTGILLARFLGVESYGQFVVLYAVLLYVNTIQFALIIAPMISIAPQINSENERTQYFQGIISLQIIFSILISLIIFLLGSRFEQWFSWGNIEENILPLAASILLFQLQDWLRRYYFICSKGKSVFFNDFVSYGGQVGLLFLFHTIGNLSISNAFWAIALSSAIAFFIGALTENIRPTLGYALPAFKHSWRIGRDLLFSGQIYWAGSQGILIFSASILGTTAAGGIRSAQNIVGLFNILFQGMENVIPIQAAQKYSQNQITGLMYYLKKISLFGGLLLALPCLVIAVLSKEIIQLIYGKEYIAFAPLIVWQLAIALIAFFRIQIFYFFRTIGYTKEIVINTIISTTMVFIIAGTFIYKLQETGILLALLLGEVVGIIFGAWAVNKYFHKLKSYMISPKQ